MLARELFFFTNFGILYLYTLVWILFETALKTKNFF